MVFQWEPRPGHQILDWRVSSSHSFGTEFAAERATAALFNWLLPLACATGQDLDLDVPLYSRSVSDVALAADVWKNLLGAIRAPRVSFASVKPSGMDYRSMFNTVGPHIIPFSGGVDSAYILSRLMVEGIKPTLVTVNNEQVWKAWEGFGFEHIHLTSQKWTDLPQFILDVTTADRVLCYPWYLGFMPLVMPPPAIIMAAKATEYSTVGSHASQFDCACLHPAAIASANINGYFAEYEFTASGKHEKWRHVLTNFPHWAGSLALHYHYPAENGIYDIEQVASELPDLVAAGISPGFFKFNKPWYSCGPLGPTWFDELVKNQTPEAQKEILGRRELVFRRARQAHLLMGPVEDWHRAKGAVEAWIAEHQRRYPDRSYVWGS